MLESLASQAANTLQNLPKPQAKSKLIPAGH
jgi:hypothetical protein